ncbi:unnamed protein product [Blepharisma stoltei]|uniref:Uncharacterized protein n=1 Tax=Blepharisma stoltei TaxID=1481888 RepID=A0AAU9JI68_9CILI|nr:unnamed protein product [Blepharisma stoltei]
MNILGKENLLNKELQDQTLQQAISIQKSLYESEAIIAKKREKVLRLFQLSLDFVNFSSEIKNISGDISQISLALTELDNAVTKLQLESENKLFESQKKQLILEITSEEETLSKRLNEFETQIREIQIRETIYETQAALKEQDALISQPFTSSLPKAPKISKKLEDIEAPKINSQELEDFLNF